MNRGKKQMSAKQRKRLSKETRSPIQPPEPEEIIKERGSWKILAKFPKKVATKNQSQVTSSEKGVGAKKRKLHSKHARRTTPGQVEKDIPPYTHIHRGGKKVIKGLEKQSVTQASRLSKKLSRKK